METLATRAATNVPKKKDSSFFKWKTSGDNFFQPKLSVGPADDVFEREADKVADRVMSNGNVETHHAISAVPVQRKCAKCEEEERLQRKAADHGEAEVSSPDVQNVLSSPGKSLDEGTRSFMENRFGYDFSQVKIHTGSHAAQSADLISALAYTSGNNIVFNREQYKPDTDSGKRLLAHELTHVVQQNTGSVQAKKIQRQCVTTAPGADEHAFIFIRNRRPVVAEFADAAGAEAFIHARPGQNLTCHRIRRHGRPTIFKVFQRTSSGSGSQSQSNSQAQPSQQGGASTVQDEIFTSAEISRMRSFFIHNASGEDAAACINTVRTGVSSLVFDDSDLTDGTCPSQLTMTTNNTMEETMTQLHGQHMASAATVIHFNDSSGHAISAGSGSEPMTLETSVWSALTTAVGSATGFSVFGMSLCDGYHSVTLTVDHTNPQSIAVFWSDQTHNHPVQTSDRIRGVSGSQFGWERMAQTGSSEIGSAPRGLDTYITYAVRRFWGLDEAEARATTPLTSAQRSAHTPLGGCAPIIRLWRISRP